VADIERFFPLALASPFCVGRPHIGTLVRWALKGVGPNRVKLKTWKIGGRRFTTREAIDQFVAALNGNETVGNELSRGRAEARARDGRELDADGVGVG